MCNCVDLKPIDRCSLIISAPIMQIISYKMSWVHTLFRGRTKPRFISGKWSSPTIFIAVCVFLLNAVASADHYDWKNAVPNRSYTPSQIAPNYNSAGTVSQRRHVQPIPHLQQHYNKIHHHQHRSQYHHHHANIDALTKASQSAGSSIKSLASAWHNTNTNDPRMSLFFADSESSFTPSMPVPLPSPPLETLVPRPRSLSSLSSSPSFNETSTNSTTTNNIKQRADSSSKIKRKTKRQRKTGKAIDSFTSSTNNAVTTSAIVPSNTELEAGTSRTFFLTPLLAYLFPVFLAQMFGMGMIPAAALITLPIFLLPLGITAAIFLI